MENNFLNIQIWIPTIGLIITVITFIITQYIQNQRNQEKYNRLTSSEQFNFK